MPTIDNLNIEINAQAVKANEAIDRLVTKLDRLTTSLNKLDGSKLTGLANGVQRLGTAMQTMNTIKTSDFTRLANNLTKLGTVNVSDLNSAASSISHLTRAFNSLGTVSANAQAVGDMAKNIAKLGNKSVQTAIANIPQLATALNNLMTTLSRSPQVSKNIIQMTNAIANLASQGSKVGSASNSIVRGLNNSSSAAEKSKKSFNGLASAFGKFYASYFIVIRGAKKLWEAIESSMDYVETLNYFNAAFGQVADNAVAQWEEAGYESADAYYNSFAERAEQLTAKMAGYTVDDAEMLVSTGQVSLGLDPGQLMNYQAMFAQMSSSMGVSSETALKLSQALTELGADLASVRNMSFEDVWTDMASGLAGMSRTLDKYGVNIRNVNLQQKLNELGIDANINALNQNDKALLRTIILLESTQYAWADMAETINQPANQMRLLQSNFSNLSRTIGNIFLPVIANAIPYVNAFVIALQRLAQWIIELLGFEGFEWGAIGGEEVGYLSDIYDQADELASGLDDASDSAKKLRQQLQGFDELNVLTTTTDIDTGVSTGTLPEGLLDEAFLDAFSNYQEVWDDAFDGLENRAQELADNIEKHFKPIKKLINDIFIGDWEAVGGDVSDLIIGIEDFFADAIAKVDWNKIGESIGEFIRGIKWIEILESTGNLIGEALEAAWETWKGAFDAAPIETAIITGIAAAKFLGVGTLVRRKISESLVGGVIPVGAKIALTLVVAKIAYDFGGWLYEHVGVIHDISDAIGEWIFKDGEEIAIARTITIALGGLAISLSAVALRRAIIGLIGGSVVPTITAGLSTGITTALPAVGGALSAAAPWVLGVVGAAVGGWNLGQRLYEIISGEVVDMPWHEQFGTIFESFTDGSWKDALDLWGQDIYNAFVEIGNAQADFVEGFLSNLGILEDKTAKAFDTVSNRSGNAAETLESHSHSRSATFGREAQSIEKNTTKISRSIQNEADYIDSGLQRIDTSIGNVDQNIKNVLSVENMASAFSGLNSTLSDTESNFEVGTKNIVEATTDLKTSLSTSLSKANMEDAMSGIIDAGDSVSKSFSETFSKNINGMLDGLSQVSVTTATDNKAKRFFTNIKRVTISGYEAGGFPERSSLFFAGENGIPEILGTVGGRTAVAGGQEITGIRDAIYDAGETEASLLQTAVGLLQVIADKDFGITERQAYDAVRRQNNLYKSRTGVSGLA